MSTFRDYALEAAKEANKRLDLQRDLYNHGGGKYLYQIHEEIKEINKMVQETVVMFQKLIKLLEEKSG